MFGILSAPSVVPLVSESLAERYNSAQALQGSALFIFEQVADDLGMAETDFRVIAAEAHEEITRLTLILKDCEQAASQAKNSARAILNLTKGNTE